MDITALPALAEGNPDEARKLQIIATSLAFAIDAKIFTPEDTPVAADLFSLFAPFFNPSYANDAGFRGLLDAYMINDHGELGPNKDLVKTAIDYQSSQRGFSDWVDAYHNFVPED